ARHRGEHHHGEACAERDVQHLFGVDAARAEDEDEQRHQHDAAADAEQAGGKADERTDAQIREPLHHLRRCATNSANPEPKAAFVTYLGSAVMRPAYLRTFATPTHLGKAANIEASLGESPTNTAAAGFVRGSRSK